MSQRYVLDYLELPSTSSKGTARFFETAFGWKATNYGPTYDAIEEGAGIDVGIDADPTSRAAAPLPVIRTDDLALAQSAVVAAGGVIVRPTYAYPGGERFHAREPGGNEFAVYRPAEQH